VNALVPPAPRDLSHLFATAGTIIRTYTSVQVLWQDGVQSGWRSALDFVSRDHLLEDDFMVHDFAVMTGPEQRLVPDGWTRQVRFHTHGHTLSVPPLNFHSFHHQANLSSDLAVASVRGWLSNLQDPSFSLFAPVPSAVPRAWSSCSPWLFSCWCLLCVVSVLARKLHPLPCPYFERDWLAAPRLSSTLRLMRVCLFPFPSYTPNAISKKASCMKGGGWMY